VYGSTKAYVLTLTEALRYEYRDKGINIMALCPGATESKFMAVATEKSKVKINTDENKGSMSFQTSEEVAHECLKAFAKNKQYIIS
jgi:short-subunit dehydrogenase